jgi:uncharacterized protein YecT (DUF1311 family)
MHMKPQRKALQLSLLMGILFLYLSRPANSQESSPGSTQRSQCENAQTTAAMRRCENIRYQKADDGMKIAYQDLLKKLTGTQKLKLQRAQIAWFKYRDAEADFEAEEANGGTLAPLIRTSVMADLTEARRLQLLKRASE